MDLNLNFYVSNSILLLYSVPSYHYILYVCIWKTVFLSLVFIFYHCIYPIEHQLFTDDSLILKKILVGIQVLTSCGPLLLLSLHRKMQPFSLPSWNKRYLKKESERIFLFPLQVTYTPISDCSPPYSSLNQAWTEQFLRSLVSAPFGLIDLSLHFLWKC